MDDKKILEDIIKVMPYDALLAAVLDLSKKTVQWQKEYNKAAERLENWTDNKQLKVQIETPEQIALSCFSVYSDED